MVNYAAVAFLVLTACSQHPERPPDNEAATPAPAAQPIPSEPASKPFSFDEENQLIEFHYGWSAEAAEVPALVGKFQADLQDVKAKLLEGARKTA